MKAAACGEAFDKEAELELAPNSGQWSVSLPAEVHSINCDDPTTEETMALVELSGALSFWEDPAEDVYSCDDGEPA
jgi:hypothetical protein